MPTRHDDLFGQIAGFTPLHEAWRKAVLGKRRKPGAAAFTAGLETQLLRLERELRDQTWRPGRYVTIEVRDPKHRLVSAAPFRDRVVHHALCGVVAPIFEWGFIDHSYANREGKGHPPRGGPLRALARPLPLRSALRYCFPRQSKAGFQSTHDCQ